MEIESKAIVLESTDQGPILEILIRGTHKDGVGNHVAQAVRAAVDTHQPAAVVINLLEFEYRWGNDIGGIIAAFIDRTHKTLRPGGILAQGKTESALRSLFELGVKDALEFEYFDSIDAALVYLRARLPRETT
jgi:hypothetical protein